MKYRIGSFNMRSFGKTAITKRDYGKLAEIIRGEQFDIIALQEIFSEGQAVDKLFDYHFKHQLYEWDKSDFGDPTPKGQKSTGEGYIFLWKKDKFKLAEYVDERKRRTFAPRIVNSLNNDQDAEGTDCSIFARTPYYIRLQPVNGGFFEIRLVDIHFFFGGGHNESFIRRRRDEFEVLTREIYPKIATNRYGVNRPAYTIALGDYNLNLRSPLRTPQDEDCYVDEEYPYQNGRKTVRIITGQKELTTLRDIDPSDTEEVPQRKYANNFDHFTYSPELSIFSSVSFKAIDAVEKYFGGNSKEYFEKISDHLPIAMDIEI